MSARDKEAAYGFRVAHRDLVDTCHYCGDAATDRDDVQPLSCHEDMLADDPELEFYRVPACGRCVAELAGAYTPDFASRRQILATRVRRWPDAQALVEWSEEELAELGPMLRSAVAKKTARQIWMLHAMRYDIFDAPEREGNKRRTLVEYAASGARGATGTAVAALSAARMGAA